MLFMGTDTTISCFASITIHAQHLKSFGIIIPSQPEIRCSTTPTQLFSVFATIIVNMINIQKFYFRLITTLTFGLTFTIVVYDF